jgi:hypothetical protein
MHKTLIGASATKLLGLKTYWWGRATDLEGEYELHLCLRHMYDYGEDPILQSINLIKFGSRRTGRLPKPYPQFTRAA